MGVGLDGSAEGQQSFHCLSLGAAAVPLAMTTKSIIRMLLNRPSQSQGKSRIGAFMRMSFAHLLWWRPKPGLGSFRAVQRGTSAQRCPFLVPSSGSIGPLFLCMFFQIFLVVCQVGSPEMLSCSNAQAKNSVEGNSVPYPRNRAEAVQVSKGPG